jgi:hypothetical protein
MLEHDGQIDNHVASSVTKVGFPSEPSRSGPIASVVVIIVTVGAGTALVEKDHRLM